MKRVAEIKVKREERFYKNRMKASKEVQKIHDRKELKEDIGEEMFDEEMAELKARRRKNRR